jgi:RNA polymerase sigma-70 factor (ECF subfamily)
MAKPAGDGDIGNQEMDVAHSNAANAGMPGGESLESLFGELEAPLLAYACRLTGDGSAAEDVLQDAFMKLHVQFAEVREPRRWLFRTVHNLALNHRRAAGRAEPLAPPDPGAPPAAEPADPQPLPDEQIAHAESLGLVRLSLQSLDDRSQELIRLKFHEDLSYQEMSVRTGLSAGLVGYTLHHALKTMADELARAGVIP